MRKKLEAQRTDGRLLISALRHLGMRVQMKDDSGNQNEYVDVRDSVKDKNIIRNNALFLRHM
jgi:hypothetical protein